MVAMLPVLQGEGVRVRGGSARARELGRKKEGATQFIFIMETATVTGDAGGKHCAGTGTSKLGIRTTTQLQN